MEESEVIDIDDLLGSATAVDAEEYDFENFSNEGDATVELVSPGLVSEPQAPSSAVTQDGPNLGDGVALNRPVKQARRKTSLEEDFKKLFLSSKTSKRSSRDTQARLARIGNAAPGIDLSAVGAEERGGGYADARVAQNEALVDAFVQGELSDAVLSEEELCIDVNSEELRQFILEFNADDGEGVTDHPDAPAPSRVKQKQALALANHRRPQSDDQDSLNSSISTAESREGSQTSSDLSPIRRTKHKVPRGKSVRFLMSNLLRNNKAQHHHHHASRTSGSEDDAKDARRLQTKPPKERSKKRDDRERERINKQHPKASKTHQSHAAAASSKSAQPVLLTPPKTPRDRTADNHAPPRSQLSAATIATPLSPGGRDNTLHKQLIQAAARGDQQVLEFLLAANEGLSQVRDSRGNTLLHAVARRGHVECLAWLAAGPCAGLLSTENDDCFTASALAVKHGQVDCVKCLAQHPDGAAELHTQGHRWSLLLLAARFGQQTCLRWLLEHMQAQGVSLDQTDHSSCSPAHLAAKYGHLHCLQTLVEFNADVTLLNKKKQSPCTLATRYHHDTCAQFLVVVETCIKLSAELTLAQRKQREIQQEKDALTKKLREALSCTDALVHTQKTDLSQRIEQLQGDYVDLTNLLVRQLDQMHRNQTQAGAEAMPREDVLVSEQKAAQLQQTCTELLDQCRQEEPNRDHLMDIERRLSRLQPPPTSPIWPVAPPERSTDLALDSMRARLSDVNQQISTLHHPSPSLASENLDTLSLSSSYASSLSSSSSSLQTGTAQALPGHSAKKRRVSWNEEASNGMPAETDATTTSGARCDERQTPNPNAKAVDSGPHDRSGDDQSLGLPHPPEFEITDNIGVQHSKGGSIGPAQNVLRPSRAFQTQQNVLHVHVSPEQWEPVRHDDTETGDESRSSEPVREVSARRLTSPPSYEESCSRLSRNPLRDESAKSTEDTAKRKPDSAKRNPDERQNSVNQTDLKSSQGRTVSSSREELETPEPYLLPSFDKAQQNADALQQYTAKQYAQQQKHCQQSVPGFMRKVQPTNEYGEPESDQVVVKISNREEMVLQPSQRGGTHPKESSHQRASSNSSNSSVSSDLPWSESDPDESPRLNRPPRGGILLRKSADSAKKSQDKHITFALDSEDAKPNTTGPPAGNKTHSSKRRDLSPIYEAPDLVKSTNDDAGKTQKVSKTEGKAQSAEAQTASNPSSSSVDSPIKRRNFRLFSYSSDEGDHDGPDEHKPQEASTKPHHEKPTYPDGLTDVVSLEFNGIGGNDDVSRCSIEDTDEKLWYESSEDEEDQEGNHNLPLASSAGYERHVCYL